MIFLFYSQGGFRTKKMIQTHETGLSTSRLDLKRYPADFFANPDQLQHLKIKQPRSKRTYSHFNCIVLSFVMFLLASCIDESAKTWQVWCIH